MAVTRAGESHDSHMALTHRSLTTVAYVIQ